MENTKKEELEGKRAKSVKRVFQEKRYITEICKKTRNSKQKKKEERNRET